MIEVLCNKCGTTKQVGVGTKAFVCDTCGTWHIFRQCTVCGANTRIHLNPPIREGETAHWRCDTCKSAQEIPPSAIPHAATVPPEVLKPAAVSRTNDELRKRTPGVIGGPGQLGGNGPMDPKVKRNWIVAAIVAGLLLIGAISSSSNNSVGGGSCQKSDYASQQACASSVGSVINNSQP